MDKPSTVKSSYQTIGEICTRLNCGPKRVKRLIREGLPAVLIAGQYMMSEKTYLEWIDGISQKKG
ncbi:MAG: helix-turn-helix domain-containing protein [Proteobacteria bacterium]|nr:helix-turn-helix domain-containing protein [Pseudomonadota bacterium]